MAGSVVWHFLVVWGTCEAICQWEAGHSWSCFYCFLLCREKPVLWLYFSGPSSTSQLWQPWAHSPWRRCCVPWVMGDSSQARERWEELAAQVPSSGNKDFTKIKQGYAWLTPGTDLNQKWKQSSTREMGVPQRKYKTSGVCRCLAN